MPKAPGKHGKTNDAGSEQQLFRQWQAVIAPLDAFTEKTLDAAAKSLKAALAEAVAASNAGGRLSAVDTRIFEAYSHLMEAYQGILAAQSSYAIPIADANARDILNGIRAVVLSRAKIYDDCGETADSANPIATEKKKLLAKSVQNAVGELDAAITNFRAERQLEFIVYARGVFDASQAYDTAAAVSNYIAEALRKDIFPAAHTVYRNTLAELTARLNDLYARRTTSYYFELLKEERDLLSSLAANQIHVLQSVLSAAQLPDTNRQFISQLCALLSHTHIRLQAEWDEIYASLTAPARYDDATKPSEALTFAAFADLLRKKLDDAPQQTIAYDDARLTYAQKHPPFLHALRQTARAAVQAYMKRQSSANDLFAHNQLLYTQTALSMRVTDVFCNILRSYDSLTAQLAETPHTEIVQGIAETLTIKTDSLRESIQILADAFGAMLQQFADVRPALDADCEPLATEIAQHTAAALLPLIRTNKYSMVLLRQTIADCAAHPLLLAHKEAAERTKAVQIEALRKKLTAHLKEHLLFEISTFEEILYYSVSRLRDAQDEATIAFVTAIDSGTSALEQILSEYGLTPINPSPHDSFNGREHEVLTAEENEDFKKGEIIKLMNRGYKRGDIILLRANVVAAK